MQFDVITTDDRTDDATDAVAPGTSCCPMPYPEPSPSYCPPEY